MCTSAKSSKSGGSRNSKYSPKVPKSPPPPASSSSPPNDNNNKEKDNKAPQTSDSATFDETTSSKRAKTKEKSGGGSSGGGVKKSTDDDDAAAQDASSHNSQLMVRFLIHEILDTFDAKLSSEDFNYTQKFLISNSKFRDDGDISKSLIKLSSISKYCLPKLLPIIYDWFERNYKFCSEKISEADSKSSFKCLFLEYLYCKCMLILIPHTNSLINPQKSAEKIFHSLKTNLLKHNFYNNSVNSFCTLLLNLYNKCFKLLLDSHVQTISSLIVSTIKSISDHNDLVYFLKAIKSVSMRLAHDEQIDCVVTMLKNIYTILGQHKQPEVRSSCMYFIAEVLFSLHSTISTEYNISTLKNFSETLLAHSIDIISKKRQSLFAYVLRTSIICIQPRKIFLSNFSSFLPEIISLMKNKKEKNFSCALHCLNRLVWIYCVKYDSEQLSAAISKFNLFIPPLFPKSTKPIFHKKDDISICVTIILSISCTKLEYAINDIVYDLIGVGQSKLNIASAQKFNVALKVISKIAFNMDFRPALGTLSKSDSISCINLTSVCDPNNTSNLPSSFNSQLSKTSAVNQSNLQNNIFKIVPFVSDLNASIQNLVNFIDNFLSNFLITNPNVSKKQISAYEKEFMLTISTGIPIILKLFLGSLDKNKVCDVVMKMLLNINENLQKCALWILNWLLLTKSDGIMSLKIFNMFIDAILSNYIHDYTIFGQFKENLLIIMHILIDKYDHIDSNILKDANLIHDILFKVDSYSLIQICIQTNADIIDLLSATCKLSVKYKISYDCLISVLSDCCIRCFFSHKKFKEKLLHLCTYTFEKFIQSEFWETYKVLFVAQNYNKCAIYFKYAHKLASMTLSVLLQENKKQISDISNTSELKSLVQFTILSIPITQTVENVDVSIINSLLDSIKGNSASKVYDIVMKSFRFTNPNALHDLFKNVPEFVTIIQDSLEPKYENILKRNKFYPSRLKIINMLKNMSINTCFADLSSSNAAFEHLKSYILNIVNSSKQASIEYEFYLSFVLFITNLMHQISDEAAQLMFGPIIEKLLSFLSHILPSATNVENSKSKVTVKQMSKSINDCIVSMFVNSCFPNEIDAKLIEESIMMRFQKNINSEKLLSFRALEQILDTLCSNQSIIKLFINKATMSYDNFGYICFKAVIMCRKASEIIKKYQFKIILCSMNHKHQIYLDDSQILNRLLFLLSRNFKIDSAKINSIISEIFINHSSIGNSLIKMEEFLINKLSKHTMNILEAAINLYHECESSILKEQYLQTAINWLINVEIPPKYNSQDESAILLLNIVYLISKSNKVYQHLHLAISNLVKNSDSNKINMILFFERFFIIFFKMRVLDGLCFCLIEIMPEIFCPRVRLYLSCFKALIQKFSTNSTDDIIEYEFLYVESDKHEYVIFNRNDCKSINMFQPIEALISYKADDIHSLTYNFIGIYCFQIIYPYNCINSNLPLMIGVVNSFLLNFNSKLLVEFHMIHHNALHKLIESLLLLLSRNDPKYIFDSKDYSDKFDMHSYQSWIHLLDLKDDADIMKHLLNAASVFRKKLTLNSGHFWNILHNTEFNDAKIPNEAIQETLIHFFLTLFKKISPDSNDINSLWKDSIISILEFRDGLHLDRFMIAFEILLSLDREISHTELLKLLKKFTDFYYYDQLRSTNQKLIKMLTRLLNSTCDVVSGDERKIFSTHYTISLFSSSMLKNQSNVTISDCFFPLYCKSTEKLLKLELQDIEHAKNFGHYDGSFISIINNEFDRYMSENQDCSEFVIHLLNSSQVPVFIILKNISWTNFRIIICLLIIGKHFDETSEFSVSAAKTLNAVLRKLKNSQDFLKCINLVNAYIEGKLVNSLTNFYKIFIQNYFKGFSKGKINAFLNILYILLEEVNCYSLEILEILKSFSRSDSAQSVLVSEKAIIILNKYFGLYPESVSEIIENNLAHYSKYPADESEAAIERNTHFTIQSLTSNHYIGDVVVKDFSNFDYVGKFFDFKFESTQNFKKDQESKLKSKQYRNLPRGITKGILKSFNVSITDNTLLSKMSSIPSENNDKSKTKVNSEKNSRQIQNNGEFNIQSVVKAFDFMDNIDESSTNSIRIDDQISWDLDFDTQTIDGTGNQYSKSKSKISFSYDKSMALFNNKQNHPSPANYHSLPNSLNNRWQEHTQVSSSHSNKSANKSNSSVLDNSDILIEDVLSDKKITHSKIKHTENNVDGPKVFDSSNLINSIFEDLKVKKSEENLISNINSLFILFNDATRLIFNMLKKIIITDNIPTDNNSISLNDKINLINVTEFHMSMIYCNDNGILRSLLFPLVKFEILKFISLYDQMSRNLSLTDVSYGDTNEKNTSLILSLIENYTSLHSIITNIMNSFINSQQSIRSTDLSDQYKQVKKSLFSSSDAKIVLSEISNIFEIPQKRLNQGLFQMHRKLRNSKQDPCVMQSHHTSFLCDLFDIKFKELPDPYYYIIDLLTDDENIWKLLDILRDIYVMI